MGEIGRVGEVLGQKKGHCLERMGMEIAAGVSRETTGLERAPPQGLRVIAAGGEVGEVGVGRERVDKGYWRAWRVWSRSCFG